MTFDVDPRSLKRLRTTQEIFALIRADAAAGKWLAPNGPPIVVVLRDDRVGDVFSHVRETYPDEPSVRIVMRMPGKGRFHCSHLGSSEDAPTTEDLPVNADSEWGMMVDALQAQGGTAMLVIGTGSFVLVGSAA